MIKRRPLSLSPSYRYFLALMTPLLFTTPIAFSHAQFTLQDASYQADSITQGVQQEIGSAKLTSQRVGDVSEHLDRVVPKFEEFLYLFEQFKVAHKRQALPNPTKIKVEREPVFTDDINTLTEPKTSSVDSEQFSVNDEKKKDVTEALIDERKTLFSTVKQAWIRSLDWGWKLILILVGLVWLIQKWGTEALASHLAVKLLVRPTHSPAESTKQDKPLVKTRQWLPTTDTSQQGDISIRSSIDYIDPRAIQVEEVDLESYLSWQKAT